MKDLIKAIPDKSISSSDSELFLKPVAEIVSLKCRNISGPHQLNSGWDINCKFRKTEMWLFIRKLDGVWILEIDSVWDLRNWNFGNSNPELTAFKQELVTKLNSENWQILPGQR